MDLSVLLPGGAGVVVLGWIGWLARKAWLRDMVIGAAGRASGICYEYLAARSHGVSSDQARRDAFAAATDYMRATVPAAIASLGISGPAVEDMVRGELGKLLSADPTVSVAAKLWPDPPKPPVPAPLTPFGLEQQRLQMQNAQNPPPATSP